MIATNYDFSQIREDAQRVERAVINSEFSGCGLLTGELGRPLYCAFQYVSTVMKMSLLLQGLKLAIRPFMPEMILQTIWKTAVFRMLLLYVACQFGGLIIDTKTDEEELIIKDASSGSNPKLIDSHLSSVYYDNADKKLYVSTFYPNGGIWVQDYANLLPDYGDLNLQSTSPAIDNAESGVLPPTITVDINGMNRFEDYQSILGVGNLDIGAYEKPFGCPQLELNFQYEISAKNYSFTPSLSEMPPGCNIGYAWTFGDGGTSSEPSPNHT